MTEEKSVAPKASISETQSTLPTLGAIVLHLSTVDSQEERARYLRECAKLYVEFIGTIIEARESYSQERRSQYIHAYAKFYSKETHDSAFTDHLQVLKDKKAALEMVISDPESTDVEVVIEVYHSLYFYMEAQELSLFGANKFFSYPLGSVYYTSNNDDLSVLNKMRDIAQGQISLCHYSTTDEVLNYFRFISPQQIYFSLEVTSLLVTIETSILEKLPPNIIQVCLVGIHPRAFNPAIQALIIRNKKIAKLDLFGCAFDQLDALDFWFLLNNLGELGLKTLILPDRITDRILRAGKKILAKLSTHIVMKESSNEESNAVFVGRQPDLPSLTLPISDATSKYLTKSTKAIHEWDYRGPIHFGYSYDTEREPSWPWNWSWDRVPMNKQSIASFAAEKVDFDETTQSAFSQFLASSNIVSLSLLGCGIGDEETVWDFPPSLAYLNLASTSIEDTTLQTMLNGLRTTKITCLEISSVLLERIAKYPLPTSLTDLILLDETTEITTGLHKSHIHPVSSIGIDCMFNYLQHFQCRFIMFNNAFTRSLKRKWEEWEKAADAALVSYLPTTAPVKNIVLGYLLSDKIVLVENRLDPRVRALINPALPHVSEAKESKDSKRSTPAAGSSASATMSLGGLPVAATIAGSAPMSLDDDVFMTAVGSDAGETKGDLKRATPATGSSGAATMSLDDVPATAAAPSPGINTMTTTGYAGLGFLTGVGAASSAASSSHQRSGQKRPHYGAALEGEPASKRSRT